MNDFYRSQSDYWFAESCREARLIGGISSCVEMATSKDSILKLTPAKAVKRIAELLADFDAETTRLRGSGGTQ